MQCASERERQKRMGTNYALPPLIVLDNLRPESKMIGLPRSKRLAGTAKALKHNLGCLDSIWPLQWSPIHASLQLLHTIPSETAEAMMIMYTKRLPNNTWSL